MCWRRQLHTRSGSVVAGAPALTRPLGRRRHREQRRVPWLRSGRPAAYLQGLQLEAGDGRCTCPCPGTTTGTAFAASRLRQVSFTSWFLDAFNYALYRRVHVLNLSVGGPDFADLPFTRKVSEVAAHNVLIVSGIGNSGPLWGTLMNPADQPEVLGVGGIDDDARIAPFSSRGMSGWELPDGAGRLKPDIVTYGSRVSGSGISGGCRELSGTSVACPVVAGAAVLLASALPEARRNRLLNPASLRQVLAQAAARLPERSAFEQGAGRLDLLRSAQALADYTPRATAVPEELDLSPCGPAGEGGAGHAPGGGGSGGYLWPYCSQPLYAGAVPLLINLTLLNGMSVAGNFSRPPRWVPRGAADGEALHVGFEYRRRLWPWGGTLGVALSVPDAAAAFDGLVHGEIVFEVGALLPGDPSPQPRSAVRVPLVVRVVPTPPRARRLLFDARHNLRYPPAYLPRDNLQVRCGGCRLPHIGPPPPEHASRPRRVPRPPCLHPLCLHPPCVQRRCMHASGEAGYATDLLWVRTGAQVTDEMLDWTGDHLFTNYRDMYIALRQVRVLVGVLVLVVGALRPR